jgi:glycosyltransferase involved in cell wall biosynthesis
MEDHMIIPRRFPRMEGGKRSHGSPKWVANQENPLVSVITVVYNGGKGLERTIRSVIDQTYGHIEYLIIDGGSTDGTLDTIRRYEASIDYWVSEPDAGISDAMNKGIAVSTGQMVGLLHAGDWLSEDQIERGVDALTRSAADYIFGDLQYHDLDGTFKFRINGDPGYADTIHNRMPVLCHPTVLVKRETYQKYGFFDTRYRIAMDYEWFLRLHSRGARGEYVTGLLGHMSVGGISDTDYIRELKEVRNIAVSYGEPKWTSNLLFLGRIIKSAMRRTMESWMPQRPYQWLRKIANHRYFPHP